MHFILIHTFNQLYTGLLTAMGSFNTENNKPMILNYSFKAQWKHNKTSMTSVKLSCWFNEVENKILNLIQWLRVLRSKLTSQSQQISDIQFGKLIGKEWESADWNRKLSWIWMNPLLLLRFCCCRGNFLPHLMSLILLCMKII